MTLDLGHLREYLLAVEGPSAGEMVIHTNWIAGFQVMMVMFGSVYRFFCNEARPTYENNVSKPPSTATVIIAYGSLIISMGFFVLIEIGLLSNLKPPWEFTADHTLQTDAWALLFLSLIWIGYPIVTIISRVAISGVPGNEYSANVSLFKDIAYGALDTTSKGGLAIYFASKAFWLSADQELALVSANHTLTS